MKNYTINKKTIAILPIVKKQEIWTHVIEIDCEFIIKEKPIKIIKDSCKYFGATLDARIVGAMSLTDLNSKLPIFIEETFPIIFIPTLSHRNNECLWFSFGHFTEILPDGKINFVNGISLEYKCDYSLFKIQIFRAAHLFTMHLRRRNILHYIKN